MSNTIAVTQPVALSASHSLQVWRTQALELILRAVVIVGLPATALAAYEEATFGQPHLALFYISVYLFLVSVACIRRIGPGRRSAMLLLTFYALGVQDLFLYGISSIGFMFLFACVILAIMLVEQRLSIGIFVVNVLTVSIASAVVIAQQTIPGVAAPGGTTPSDALFYILFFVMIASMLGWSVLSLIAQLTQTIGEAEELARQATAARDQAEYHAVALAQRTIELAEAMAEAQQARTVAEQANRMKSQFLANMSHELRTPLNSIINFTRILLSGMRGSLNDGQKDYLNRVRASGEHLLGLINDILDLSKIEAGRMELYKEPCQMGELVQSVLATAVGLTKGKPITLQHDITPDLPSIDVDRTRIRQILLNLLSNAAKFTDAGTITVGVDYADQEIIVSVTDTGIGIAPEQLDAIFEEFHQANSGNNRSYEGTGLGLAISQRLINLHGGRIWVESSVGGGSTFAFTLPTDAAPTHQATQRTSVYATAIQTGPTILVVDDDPGAIEIVASYLERDGYTVYGVSDSRRALDEAHRIQPAAVILDILMPHKDGWEVLADFKADPQLQLVPIILYTITEEQQLGLHLGASAYLVKPVDEEQLRSTVKRLLPQDASILIIDDDPDVLDMVTEQLAQTPGYRVMTASSGQEGLARLVTTVPDLVILDLMMPEIDGFHILTQLDLDQRTQDMPVIVMTAKDLTNEERLLLNERVRGLVSKGGTSLDELLNKVHLLLSDVGIVCTTHVPNESRWNDGKVL